MMSNLDLIHQAIQVALDMEIPDEDFAEAVKSQACLMAGVGAE